jgi:hypothetical protein
VLRSYKALHHWACKALRSTINHVGWNNGVACGVDEGKIYFSGRIGAAAAGDGQSDMHLDLLRKHLGPVFRHHCTTFEKDGTFLHTSTATARVRKSRNMRARVAGDGHLASFEVVQAEDDASASIFHELPKNEFSTFQQN